MYIGLRHLQGEEQNLALQQRQLFGKQIINIVPAISLNSSWRDGRE